MMKAILYFLVSATAVSTCKKTGNGIPVCIQQKIEVLKNQLKSNPPLSVTEYTYRNQKVYYIPPACCDQYSAVYDKNCMHLGAPGGGITGKGDGRLPNFFNEVKNEKIIWKDSR